MTRPVASFTGDGAFDRDDVYDALAERHPEAAAAFESSLESELFTAC